MLIVDDSALVRKVMTEILSSDPAIEVVGAASDPHDARNMIKELNPDVLTLDVEMPRMDGITFLGNLMRLRPMPVVMVSSLTETGADVTLTALELGAIDFVTKPKLDVAHGLQEYADEITAKVKAAARARPRARVSPEGLARPGIGTAAPLAVMTRVRATDRLLAIGASTGGTEAIREVLEAMPPDAPPTVITQHIPEAFSKPFAERLDRHSHMRVCEATRRPADPARARLRRPRQPAPQGEPRRGPVHLQARQRRPGEPAQAVGRRAVRVGGPTGRRERGGCAAHRDGGRRGEGDEQILDAGAPTIAQDEATSVVWGMPGEAVKLGAAKEVLPLSKIAKRALELATG